MNIRARHLTTTRSAPLLAGFAVGAVALSAHGAPPNGQNYKIVFADEFNGTSLDTMKWVDTYPWGSTHNHQAYADPDNVILGDGTVTLLAERRAQGGKPFTSAAISTGYTKFRLSGGYVEARIKLPSTPGSWPAFWGLDNGWPPEADIMEFPLTTDGGTNGYPNTDYHTAFHYTNGSGNAASGAGRVNPGGVGELTADYHTFGMEWVEDASVAFYFDGAQVSSFNNAAVAQMTSMYLILNYAVGGWPGTPSTAQWPTGHTDETKIDWVRVWQRAGTSGAMIDWLSNRGSGSWDTAANWNGEVPKFEDYVARFGANDNAAVSATWNSSRAVGGLLFDTATAFTVGDGDAGLQFARSSGNATINVSAATTANQTINARVELYDTVNVTNGSAQTLTLSGKIVGDGGMTFDGPGTVVLSNNNEYTGNTTIDSGTQGPAVVRVTRSRAFGTGVVTLSAGGNATTARLEIMDNRELPNAIHFSGRGNTSAGIRNISGNNLLSGTISLQSGGGNYIIQSDAGLLTLSGAAAGANGVALRVGAGSARTLTLQGAGNGDVSGIIEDGNQPLSIMKLGGGTWTLGADNTYTGATTINDGTLAVNGTHVGGGAYAVGAAGTLGGIGTIDPSGASAVTVAGRLAPGHSVGTLTVGSAGSANDVVLADGGELHIEVGPSGSADVLSVFGALNLSAAGDELRLISLAGAFDGSDYTIAAFAPGGLAGNTFGSVYLDGVLQPAPASLMGNGYRLAYDDVGGAIRLVAVPEPAALAVLTPCALLLARHRRGRPRR